MEWLQSDLSSLGASTCVLAGSLFSKLRGCPRLSLIKVRPSGRWPLENLRPSRGRTAADRAGRGDLRQQRRALQALATVGQSRWKVVTCPSILQLPWPAAPAFASERGRVQTMRRRQSSRS